MEKEKIREGDMMMSVQILIATMNQQDHSLLEKMNIQTDVIVGNQCNHDSIESFDYKGHHAIYLNFNERGVGLNRNNALMRAKGDICLFGDDDMTYVDGYEKLISNAFYENPKADVICFNLIEENSHRKQITKKHKVWWLNYLTYGTARIAVKLSSIKKNGIYFNQCFGGGTEHCHGEDNLFLTSCLKNGLNIIAIPIDVAELKNERKSTWNEGYNDKYLKDQGTLYKTISKKWWRLLCLQDAIRKHREYSISWRQAYNKMTMRG